MQDKKHWFNKPCSWDNSRKLSNYHFDKSINDSLNPDIVVDQIRFIGDWSNEIKLDQFKSGYNPETATTDLDNNFIARRWIQEMILLGQNPAERHNKRIKVSRETHPKIFKMPELLGIEGKINIHCQLTGDINYLHIDTYDVKNSTNSNADYDLMIQQHPNTIRLMIHLTDWEWGHFVQFGNYIWSGWKAGSVGYWSWKDIPHATANAGHLPRIVGIVHGKATPKFYDMLRNDDPIIINV